MLLQKIKYLLCIFATLSFIDLLGQPSIPVDPLTGRADVTIPIWNLVNGQLSVPVALVYNSGGIKVEEKEGHAGVGWNLAAGGAVYREVRGIPDDYFGNGADPSDLRRGWLSGTIAQEVNNHTSTSDDDLNYCSDEQGDWTFLNNLAFNKDTEPDVYSFSAPGLSGQFVFGPDKLPKLIPYQDVQIVINNTTPTTPTASSVYSIVVTKNDGTKYTFGTGETTTRQAKYYTAGTVISQYLVQKKRYEKPLKFTSSWYLSSIQSPTGQIITFSRGPELISNSIKDVMIGYQGTSTGQVSKQYYMLDIVKRKNVTAINGASQSIVLEWLYANEMLTKITVKDNVFNDEKVFTLGYRFVKNPSDALGSKKRMYLNEVREASVNCDSFPAYIFEYYDIAWQSGWAYAQTTLPFHNDTTKQDMWGYFNDAATSKKPTLYYYASKSGAEKYRYYPIPGLSATATITGGTDRSVNPAKVMYGALKKITYPTGGDITITYEPNSYFDVEANQDNYGPGLRVAQLDINENVVGAPATVLNYEYKTTDNKSSGKWVYRPAFGYHDVTKLYATRDDQSPEPMLLYERATIRQVGKGKTVYEYILPGMYPLATATPDWTATKNKVARNYSGSCSSQGLLTNDYYRYPFAPNKGFGFERGLINKVSEYSNLGSLLHEKTYTYQRLNTSASLGKSVKGIRYELLNDTQIGGNAALGSSNIFVFGQYTLFTNENKLVLTETDRTMDMADLSKVLESSTTYTFNSTHYLLDYLTQQNSDGITYKTKYKYAKDFANLTNPSGDVNSQMIKKLNDDFQHGAVVETINSVINGSETVTGATLNLYGSFSDSLSTKTFALPVASRVFNGTTGFSEATVVPASGSNQALQFSPSVYRQLNNVDQYDFYGNALALSDNQKNISSVHLGFKNSLPIATIRNAAADEALFAGFETYTGGEFNIIPTGLSRPTGRSGRKALQMINGTLLQRTNIVKGNSRYYRYSCFVNGGNTAQLTFKVYNGTTLVGSAAVPYEVGDIGQWKYAEGIIDLNAITTGSVFKLTMESNATIAVDDIAFYPETASVTSYTYDPLYGKTSVTDSRGTSMYYEYDNLGRLKYIKDQDKNLRQTSDYYYYAQEYPELNATFSTTHQKHQVVTGAQVTYTAGFNCSSPVTHDWYVNDVKLGNNVTQFTYTYSTPGQYVLKHTVSHPTYGSKSYSITYDVITIGNGPM
ncbi:MAG: hypothetical protein KDC93_17215, partial [Cyclobacteriaceae bacterium]|nr:hypothetical protein [Cyclobacteriaceae bacterium]